MKKNLILTLICILFAGLNMRADVKLSAIFSDNMVLQQQSQVDVWGWAKPNTNVSIVGSWDRKTYTVRSHANGYFRTKISTPNAGFTPHTLTISDGKPVVLQNVLIGEVWIASGQSNMEMPMKGFRNEPIEGGPEAIVSSANPGIRCFTLRRNSTLTPQDDCSGIWEVANPETTPEFTATGYFFARLINQVLNVPVGVIHTSWNGSAIEAWMTSNSLKTIPEKIIPTSQADITSPHRTPTLLYNGMIHPIVGYGMRGAIWYQGESNRQEPELYAKLFDAMIREWRNLWTIGEFPFYYCQIAPYNYEPNFNTAYLREAQHKVMSTTPNTGMAVLMDVGNFHSIHPPQKREAGERLALWALAQTYGMAKMHYRSPELRSFETEGRVAVLTFDMSANPGLTTYGQEILNFQVAGENKRFSPAKAAVLGNKVYVFSPLVDKPVAVRYCWDNTSASEIFTVEGNLPVSSFRTDDW
ncbi:MAG: sialate O-acetylesterase [Bacteroidales bacterium]|jgi:sialate O-acetylesterase|nr:sialate O-acetylesterase [Bacteroidales bacterium]